MPEKQVIGAIPEFSSQEENELTAPASGATPEAQSGEEQETETPSEPSSEQKPAEAPEKEHGGDIGDAQKDLEFEIQGLRTARRELIEELKDLRGQKRDLKQQEIAQIDQQIDDLKDINQDDVALIERIFKAKGYASKQDIDQMFYKSRKQEEIAKFFKEFPEYNEDKDPDRKRFQPLLAEISLYKEPTDPTQWGTLLRRAHRTLSSSGTSDDRGVIENKRQQIKIAGSGSAGSAQRSSSVKSFDPKMREYLRNGGWSEEDIQRMEKD